MPRFVLTAELNLQAPRNLRQVVSQMQSQLGTVNVNLAVRNGPQAQRQLGQLNSQMQQANGLANTLGRNIGVSVRRFVGFAIATRAVTLFTSGLANATKEAINFERELIKISQVTGNSISSLQSLENTITDLSTSLGTSSKSLLSATRILAQAGIEAARLDTALSALAKTTLAPTFENIEKTAEGAVAIIAQFGQGVGALEEQLGAINAVAGQFAVESGDLISVIRRTGGVFKAAGGDLNELIALFTSVRATTRESAESIATGLRTIFTRIQRPATIQFLKQLGVELTDLNGKFVGPYDAVRQLSKALSGLGEGDIRFVQIAEELGGFRQIGKVIPLLQQFETAEKARQAAIAGAGSLDKDAITAQKSLAVQLEKTREKFLALIRSVTETSTFQASIRTMLGLADSLIAVADAIKPLLPLLGALGAFSAIRGIAGFGRNFARGFSGAPAARNQGGPIGFATGGVVPGVGNSDSVPAMLTPGEFVIRKSSVKKIGADNLSAMNAKGYARGGVIQMAPGRIGGFFLNPPGKDDPRYKSFTGANEQNKITLNNKQVIDRLRTMGITPLGEVNEGVRSVDSRQLAAFASQSKGGISAKDRKSFGLDKMNTSAKGAAGKNNLNLVRSMTPENRAKLEKQYFKSNPVKGKKGVGQYNVHGKFTSFFPGGSDFNKNKKVSQTVDVQTKKGLRSIVSSSVKAVNAILDILPQVDFNDRVADRAARRVSRQKSVVATIGGYVNEGLIEGLTGAKLAPEGAFFDFPSGSIGSVRERLGKFFGDPGQIARLIKGDAKRSDTTDSWKSIIQKIGNDINTGNLEGIRGVKGPGFAKGGPAPSDTVPAMLTPGEFVINKKAAASIGRANLNRMNKQGVAGFAAGGPVAYLNQGGTAGGGIGAGALTSVGFAAAFIPRIEEATTATERLYNSLLQSITTSSLLISAVSALTASENASNAAQTQDNVIDSQANAVEAASTEATIANTAVEQSLSTIIAANTAAIQANTVALGGSAVTDAGSDLATVGLVGTMTSQKPPVPPTAPAAPAATGMFGRVGAIFSRLAMPVAVTAAAVYGLGAAIDAFNGEQDKANKLQKEGNTAAAGNAAINAKIASDGTALSTVIAATTAAIAAFSGPFAPVVIAVGGLAAAIAKFLPVQEAYRSVMGRFTGETADVIRQRATQAAQQVKTEKELEEASKKTTKVLEDFGRGAATVDQVFAALGSSVKAELDLINANIAYAEAQIRAEEGKFFGANEENVQESRDAIEKEQKKREELFSNKISEALSSDALRRSIENAVIGGGRVDPNDVLVKLFGGNLSLVSEDDKKKFIDSVNNMSAAAEENAAFLRSLNFGLRDVSSAIGATSLAVDTAVASFEPGFNSASLAAQTLGVAMTSAGANISQSSVDQSLQQLSQRFIDLGGDVESVKQLTGTISEITRIQRQAPDLIKNITDNLDLGGTAGPDLVENFQKGLLSLIPDNSPVKARFLDFFSTLEFDKLPDEIKKQIAAGNFEKLFDYSIKEISASAQEQVDAFEESAKTQDKLLPIIKKRIDLEDKLASAQKESLKLQLEAAEAIEKFGGPAVTTAERLENLNAQLNVDLGNTGLGITATGSSPQELVRINRQLLAEYEKQTAAGARGGPQGVENEKQRENIQKANKSLVDNLRQRIKLSEQEVELAKKKNDLEKSALQKLIEGDTAGFLEEQRAAVAGRALRRGDSRLLGLLGAKEIAKGFASVQEDAGASDFEKRLAARLALGPGFASERNIDILTGITPEIQALQSAGMGAATALKEVADSAGKFIQADIQQVKGNILKVEGIIQNQAGEQQVSGLTPTTTLSRGGTVYANNGVFVPRGTDTVPAMLTPGEYVVNRDAVNKGNNLSILQAMNSGKTTYAKTGGLIANGVVYMAGKNSGLVPDVNSVPDGYEFLRYDITGNEIWQNPKTKQIVAFKSKTYNPNRQLTVPTVFGGDLTRRETSVSRSVGAAMGFDLTRPTPRRFKTLEEATYGLPDRDMSFLNEFPYVPRPREYRPPGQQTPRDLLGSLPTPQVDGMSPPDSATPPPRSPVVDYSLAELPDYLNRSAQGDFRMSSPALSMTGDIVANVLTLGVPAIAQGGYYYASALDGQRSFDPFDPVNGEQPSYRMDMFYDSNQAGFVDSYDLGQALAIQRNFGTNETSGYARLVEVMMRNQNSPSSFDTLYSLGVQPSAYINKDGLDFSKPPASEFRLPADNKEIKDLLRNGATFAGVDKNGNELWIDATGKQLTVYNENMRRFYKEYQNQRELSTTGASDTVKAAMAAKEAAKQERQSVVDKYNKDIEEWKKEPEKWRNNSLSAGAVGFVDGRAVYELDRNGQRIPAGLGFSDGDQSQERAQELVRIQRNISRTRENRFQRSTRTRLSVVDRKRRELEKRRKKYLDRIDSSDSPEAQDRYSRALEIADRELADLDNGIVNGRQILQTDGSGRVNVDAQRNFWQQNSRSEDRFKDRVESEEFTRNTPKPTLDTSAQDQEIQTQDSRISAGYRDFARGLTSQGQDANIAASRTQSAIRADERAAGTLEGERFQPQQVQRGFSNVSDRNRQIMENTEANDELFGTGYYGQDNFANELRRRTDRQVTTSTNTRRAQENAYEIRMNGANPDEFDMTRFAYQSRGGLIYASRGKLIKSIFKPRGTDTVPAMLTPGEFVVNRQAVNAGNNLAVLKAMNSQPASPVTMSKGGQVGGTQYLQSGGEVAGSSQDSSYLNALEDQLAKLAQKLETGFATFGQHVETFQGATQTEMAVNVNQTGSMRLEAGSTLSSSLMKNSKDIATASVNGQIDKTSLGMDGKLRTTGSVLGTA